MRWSLFLVLGGCVSLDSFVHNGVPCTQVGPATCEDKSDIWDKVCVPCETPYDWSKSFDWMEGTLTEGESIRNPDPETVVNFTIPTEDGEGELDAYFIPSHGEDAALAETTLLYNHGNYAGIEHYQPRVHMAHEMGFNVMVWDYRGYGKSTPHTSPTSEQFMSDSVLARQVAEEYAPDPERILPYAFSLGGIPTMEMAVQTENCAIIMEAAFTSIDDIIRSNSGTGLPATFLTSGDYENHQKMAQYDGPIFAMIGTADRKFTVESWTEIIEEASGPKDLWVLEGVDHGIGSRGIPEAGYGEYAKRVREFLSEHAPDCIGSD